MKRRAAATLILLTLTGCGNSQPKAVVPLKNHFDVSSDATRVFEKYDQQGGLGATVTVPRDANDFVFQFDCTKSGGKIHVDLDSIGSGTLGCRASTSKSVMVLGLGDESRRGTSITFTIDAPGLSKWSVAVDARNTTSGD